MNINETNINGLEDVYNYIKKASKAHVQSGNLSLIKNLVLKVLDSLNKGNCDYDSATNAIEDIFSIGRRANKYQTVPESTRVDTALEILKENGYQIIKEDSAKYTLLDKHSEYDEDTNPYEVVYGPVSLAAMKMFVNQNTTKTFEEIPLNPAPSEEPEEGFIIVSD